LSYSTSSRGINCLKAAPSPLANGDVKSGITKYRPKPLKGMLRVGLLSNKLGKVRLINSLNISRPKPLPIHRDKWRGCKEWDYKILPQAPKGDVKSGILELLILKQRYNHLKLIPAYSLEEEINFTIPFANILRASSI